MEHVDVYRYIAYDPQEDTETGQSVYPVRPSRRYIAYDPQEDTETDQHEVRRRPNMPLHRLRSARGY